MTRADAADPEPADLLELVAVAPSRARTQLDVTLRGLVTARTPGPVADQVAACAGLLQPLVRRRYTDSAPRLADVERLASAAGAAPDLEAFVAQVTLDPPASTGDYAKPPHLDEDYVTLSTVHSAKGLEWPAVHLIHAIDGAFPSDMALTDDAGVEEEQRLFYVAVTRSRDELAIYTPLRLPHHRRARDDRHSYAPASRFLTDEAVATMQIEEPPRPAAVVSPAAGLPRVTLPSLDALFS